MTTSEHPDNAICLRCTIAGQVQGVFFRASAREEALRLGVSGHAHNLPDGRVEVLACGEPAALDRLRSWLWEGSPAAEVTEVVAEEADETPPSGFATR